MIDWPCELQNRNNRPSRRLATATSAGRGDLNMALLLGALAALAPAFLDEAAHSGVSGPPPNNT